MRALAIIGLGAYGVHLVYTAFAYRWGGIGVGPVRQATKPSMADRIRTWLDQAGLNDVTFSNFASAIAIMTVTGIALGWALFGGVVPALGVGVLLGSMPPSAWRNRRKNRIEAAHEGWPQMIEEIRVLTGSAGRSIPQALFEVGRNGPPELRDAFAAAHRDWLLSTDFDRTVEILTTRLADPTADATCETLLVAHETGGADLDRRLSELAEDRRIDNLGRKDARAKQAGVRFARRFVIGVPLGMALAGMSLGDGRSAYQTPVGQLLVAVGLAIVALCWAWSARMLRMPNQDRVFV